ncbi:MAG TPA: serine/threonine-protein kinase [Polyangia bacterium]|nr:serine/threonine-protein kinase [Polyangia bacterium]
MDRDRARLVQDLFFRALDLPAAERAEALRAAGADPSVAAEVLELLELDAETSGDSVLSRGLAETASRLLGAEARALPPDIGPYHIVGVLGEGGMGTVFRAERLDTKGAVAIKVLRDARLSPARRYRFEREQRLLAQLRHPAIAQIYDAGSLPDGTPFFAMELVDGVPITRYCHEHRSSIDDRLRLFRAVCEAVQHAHQQAVIHRDLKPSNVLVTREGRVKLLDFGISKRMDDTLVGSEDVTRDGLRFMTPAYAAPEQLRAGRTAMDTDVYSLGVVLYELLAGRPPFELGERTPSEALEIVLKHEVERPSAAWRARGGGAMAPGPGRSQWADLDMLVLKSMHREADRRYPTVEALARDVDHYFKGEPLEGRPDEVAYRLGKFVRRHRRPLAGAALAVGAVAAVVVFYTGRLARARDAAVAEAERTKRVEGFTRGLFDAGEKDYAPSKDLRVVSLLDRGLTQARGLAADPTAQSDLYATLGSIYERLGNVGQADWLLRAALDERRALYGPAHPLVAESEIDLALLLGVEDKPDEAERRARSALATAESLRPASPAEVAAAKAALGVVLEGAGRYEEAAGALAEAVRYYAANRPESGELASSVTELANTRFYLADYDASWKLDEQALALHRKLNGDRHPTYSSDLFNLAAIKQQRGEYAEAERYCREGLAITRAWFDPEHPQVAADATMLGRVLSKEKKYDEARPLLEEALRIQEHVHGADDAHPAIASALNELGLIARETKRYDEATRAFTRMVDIYRKVYPKGHYLQGLALANLASVSLARGDDARAVAGFNDALAVYARTLPSDHDNVAIARVKLGRALLGERRYGEAEAQSRSGYEILQKKAVARSIDWLQWARADLAAEYEALGRPEEASRFRQELSANER